MPNAVMIYDLCGSDSTKHRGLVAWRALDRELVSPQEAQDLVHGLGDINVTLLPVALRPYIITKVSRHQSVGRIVRWDEAIE